MLEEMLGLIDIKQSTKDIENISSLPPMTIQLPKQNQQQKPIQEIKKNSTVQIIKQAQPIVKKDQTQVVKKKTIDPEKSQIKQYNPLQNNKDLSKDSKATQQKSNHQQLKQIQSQKTSSSSKTQQSQQIIQKIDKKQKKGLKDSSQSTQNQTQKYEDPIIKKKKIEEQTIINKKQSIQQPVSELSQPQKPIIKVIQPPKQLTVEQQKQLTLKEQEIEKLRALLVNDKKKKTKKVPQQKPQENKDSKKSQPIKVIKSTLNNKSIKKDGKTQSKTNKVISQQHLNPQKKLVHSTKKYNEDYDANDSFIDDNEIEMDSEQRREVDLAIKRLRQQKQKIIDDDEEDIKEVGFDQLEREQKYSRIVGYLEDERELYYIKKQEEKDKEKAKQKMKSIKEKENENNQDKTRE